MTNTAIHHEATDYVGFDYERYTSNPNVPFLDEEERAPLPRMIRWLFFGACIAVVIAVPTACKIYEWWIGQ
jgi:hypothetical protein